MIRLGLLKRIILITCLTCGVCAAVEIPDTPAGNRAREILELMNGSGTINPEDYVKNNYSPEFQDAFPMAQHLSVFTSMGAIFGKLTVYEVSESSDFGLKLNLKAESRNAYLGLALNVEPDKPHRITSMMVAPVQPSKKSEETQPENKDDKSENKLGKKQNLKSLDKDRLHQTLTQKAQDNEFSGTVMIARDGEILFHHAYGFASKRFKVKNTLETKYNLGSCNKLFTAIGIAQLMQRGDLSIDDPISKYLDYFPAEISGNVTIRHLLQMRAGWGDYWANEYYLENRNQLRDVSDYMEFIKDIPLDFEPGSNFQHCNTCYEIMGAIIEVISGMDYFDYIRENIYKQVGMKNSDSFDRDGPADNLAMGYTNMNRLATDDKKYAWSNNYILSPRGTPAGGGYSTTGDLLKFDNALRSYKLLNQAYTHFLFNRWEGSSEDDPGLPSRISRTAGGAPGVSADIIRDFNHGYTIIVLSNYDFPVANDVAAEIIEDLSLM